MNKLREAATMALKDLLIIWNDSRPSVSALRAALAEQPAAPAEFARICDSLPEGVNWGDPMTPAMARHIFESAIPPGHVVVKDEPVAWWFEYPDKRIAPKFDTAPHGGNWKPLYAARPGVE